MISTDLLMALNSARQITVLTGAGISAESGIPTFRDAQTGLWENCDATVLASPEGYCSDRPLVWGWYEFMRLKVLKARPNAAHIAIKNLAEQVERLTLITQNVDDLHERAGIADVIHLHGSLHEPLCFECENPYVFSEAIPEAPEEGRLLPPPHCPYCNGYIRPGVVWFGESLPMLKWKRAELAAKECDLFLSIGTSSMVWPASQLPIVAARMDAIVIQINPEVTQLDQIAHYNLHGKAGDILPGLVKVISKKYTSVDALRLS